MKTPQVSWSEVDAIGSLVEDTKHGMKCMLINMRAKLAKASNYEAEALRESIADLEADLAEVES